jgi:hypothetical protein
MSDLGWAWVTCHECFSAFLRVITLSPFEIQITPQPNKCIYIYYCMTVSLIAALPVCVAASAGPPARSLSSTTKRFVPSAAALRSSLSCRCCRAPARCLRDTLAKCSPWTAPASLELSPSWSAHAGSPSAVEKSARTLAASVQRRRGKTQGCSALVGKSPIAPASSDWGAGLE